MNPSNQPSKILRIALGVAVFGFIAYTTVFGEKKSDLVTTANQAYTDAVPQVMGANDSTVVSGVQNQAKTKTETVTRRRFFEDDEEEGEDDEERGNIPNQPLPPATVVENPTTKKAVVYKDGTYSATGSYMSPGGQDLVGVTLTLSKGIVTDVSTNMQPGDNTSARYMSKFESGYKTLVVGKNIADINLTKVSGASLTPIGFNNALTQIKSKAKA